MLISFVVPAYNASRSISRTIASIFGSEMPVGWSVETIVVDDGSEDGSEIAQIIAAAPDTRMVSHTVNRGMCAARNSGIANSKGDVVIILDADDEVVAGWPQTLEEVLVEWPHDCKVCYAACRNERGEVTAVEPKYRGRLTLDDIVNERHAGEYLPVFRGEYIRTKLYIDLGMQKSCGIVSYINFAHDAPFWITNKVLRIYHESQPGSVTDGWVSPAKAAETARCYEELFERYGELYRRQAPRTYCSKRLRLAVYRRLAHVPGAWQSYRQGVSLRAWRESLGAGVLLLLGGRLAGALATSLKRVGFVRRYG